MRLLLIFFLLAGGALVAKEIYPATHQSKRIDEALKVWKAPQTIEYQGDYAALEADHDGSSRLILLAYHDEATDEIRYSAVVIDRGMLTKPTVTLINELVLHPDKGLLVKDGVTQIQMKTYLDPNTSAPVKALVYSDQVYAILPGPSQIADDQVPTIEATVDENLVIRHAGAITTKQNLLLTISAVSKDGLRSNLVLHVPEHVKSSQIQELKQYFESRGVDVILKLKK